MKTHGKAMRGNRLEEEKMVDAKVMEMIQGLRAGADKIVEELGITGEYAQVPARSGQRQVVVYRPADAAEDPLPVFIDVHGGGFIYGRPELDDEFCRRVADELGVVVVSPSYRLAPESMFPADKEDVFDVVKYVHDNPEKFGVDPARMAIGGHSAGGNISTVVAMMAKETGAFKLKCVIMDYPTVDLDTDAHAKPTPEGCIPPDLAAVFDLCYRDPKDGKNPHLSPLFAEQEQLVGLPPHLILTAEGDSLCFEGEEYAKRLMAAGVPTTGKRFFGVGHGYSMPRYGMGKTPVAEAAAEECQLMMIDALRKYL
ncbi:alpha/beta hydrolase fold domain-containing protein [Eggerthellaceae bacterium zg-893]|nr:alpha/beta hydrolase fold domain-containing protein [Eggerthellaceae bacterium zg-893]